jgi:CMP-N,N'-diacetyllegionaminic acid synthase
VGGVQKGDNSNGDSNSMIDNKSFLAIIPARGGSKRLPRKNLMKLLDKPLIAWTIQAGRNSTYIDKVIVTSDDEEILSVAGKYGVEIIKRPSVLATDSASTFDAVKHVIDNFIKYDYVVLLQPTSPLRNEKHIDEAIGILISKKADAVISVCETEHSPLWCNILPENGSMENFLIDENKNKRGQDLDRYYRLNGAIYICSTERLLCERSFFINDNIYAYLMDNEDSVDIDNLIDFKLAEFLLQRNLNY